MLVSTSVTAVGEVPMLVTDEGYDSESVSLTDNLLSNDSIKIYFKLGKSIYDPDLGNNREVLSRYIERLTTLNNQRLLNEVVVEGYVSPDGKPAVNERLAMERSEVLADILVRETGIDRAMVKTVSAGINWVELRRLIALHPDVPSREALLNIIDNTPIAVYDKRGNLTGGRKKSLMDLRGGRPYRWLYENIFPEMRNAVGISINYIIPAEETEPVDIDKADADSKDETYIQIETGTNIAADESVIDNQNRQDSSENSTGVNIADDHEHRMALKTNLLDYAILMPNIELEWHINDRWSVALEGQRAWYAKTEPHKVYRIGTVMPEVRYWAISHSRWHGMYVGLFAGGGMYDLSNGKKGHEGEGGLLGVSIGYMWPISKHLSLEAGLGAGYLRLKDKSYVPRDNHFLYQVTKNINYFGPLRLKLSLVWRFWNDKSKSAR